MIVDLFSLSNILVFQRNMFSNVYYFRLFPNVYYFTHIFQRMFLSTHLIVKKQHPHHIIWLFRSNLIKWNDAYSMRGVEKHILSRQSDINKNYSHLTSVVCLWVWCVESRSDRFIFRIIMTLVKVYDRINTKIYKKCQF